MSDFFLFEKFNFLVEKFSIYLNRRVFVMLILKFDNFPSSSCI